MVNKKENQYFEEITTKTLKVRVKQKSSQNLQEWVYLPKVVEKNQ